MENFKKMGEFNPGPLREELKNFPELWNENHYRTLEGLPHQDADDIWLRFSDLDTYQQMVDFMNALDDLDCKQYEGWNLLHKFREQVYNIMQITSASVLGKAIITRIPDHGKILPHCDEGLYARTFYRYHAIVDNYPGSIFRCGEEEICMEPGEIWWFDASKQHEVINNSGKDRISLIVDVANISEFINSVEKTND